ncbi:MAG: bifunctional phosphopantothenoylcysteine decarboxylase/phosphopantothenate--cysteine ligase CoaBC [Thermoproteota archaeon]
MSRALLWEDLHPSWSILGEEDGDLRGKCIVLGVTASASMYRSIDLARALMRMGAVVRVAMTPEAAKLISPEMFSWATGLPAVTEMTGAVEHVSLARLCDAVVVAPASLETLSEIASFGARTVVSALVQEALGLGKPVLAVPAMHEGMWRRASKLVRELEEQGLAVMSPVLEGDRAKYPPVELVAWWAEAVISRGRDLAGRKLLVTAGPTREHIDPVRVVTNPSSGLMGLAVALEASWRGAEVHLVHGPLCAPVPSQWRSYVAEAVRVERGSEMAEAVAALASRGIDAAVYAAAVSDYRPASEASSKIPSERGALELRLEPTEKVVARGLAAAPNAVHVGFAAETARSVEELLEKARRKLEKYRLDAVAANNVLEEGAGFGFPTNHVYVVDRAGTVREIPRMHKRLVARRLLDIVRELLEEDPGSRS